MSKGNSLNKGKQICDRIHLNFNLFNLSVRKSFENEKIKTTHIQSNPPNTRLRTIKLNRKLYGREITHPHPFVCDNMQALNPLLQINVAFTEFSKLC